VDESVTLPLRQEVLRPGQTLPATAAETGSVPGLVAFAALEGGRVVGTAVVYPEPLPEQPGTAAAWRLRGMATASDRRHQGVGTQVLAAVLAHVAGTGAQLMWCNARVPAQRFYERAGFAAVGESWDDPDLGPHVRMWRML